MLPRQYGGGGLSNVDFVIAAEEIQAVDPGFGTTVLVNGLGLMPIWYYGTEEQKERFIRRRPPTPAANSSWGTPPANPPGRPEAQRTSTPPRSAEPGWGSPRSVTATTM